MGINEQLEKLRDKLDETPVNKGTETERARLKGRIAELQAEQEQRQKETGGGYSGYSIKQTGDATVALVGPPSVGKSTFLNAVTNADSETGDYEFTTLDVVPGMLQHRGANIQLLDVPGLIGGAATGKGDGKQVLSVIRGADAVILMTDSTNLNGSLDVSSSSKDGDQEPSARDGSTANSSNSSSPEHLDGFELMEQELSDAGVRLNTEPPNVKITKKDRGGLAVKTPVEQTHLDVDTVETVLRDRGYVNAAVLLREDVTLDRLIDAVMGNRVYLPAVKAVNKADTLDAGEREQLTAQYPDAVLLSAETGDGVDELVDAVYDALALMPVYMKQPGKDADLEEPLIVPRGSTIMNICERLPGDMDERFDYAKIWGESAAFDAQQVGGEHVLQEGDVVEIRTR